MQKINITHLQYLQALFDERNVTRAAEVMGVGQPAMSAVLAKLRHELDDMLFIKTKNGMEPTAKASEIVKKVRELQQVMGNKGIVQDEQDLNRVRYEFKIMSSDSVARLFLPGLMNACEAVAPGISIRIITVDQRQISDYLSNGDVDLAVASFGDLALDIRKVFLYQQKLMAITRRGHPQVRGELNLQNLAEIPHASWESISLPRPAMESILDRSLSQMAVKRNIAVRVPALPMIPELVEQTNLMACIPEILARHAAKSLRIDVWELPVPVEALDVSMTWHEKYQHDVAHRWIRNEIVKITQSLR